MKNPEAALKKLLAKTGGLKMDYVQLVGDRLCAAIYAGKTRLIDNERIARR
jgi:pantothenate synthetase